MFLVHDSYDTHSPYVACEYHVEDLRRVDFDNSIRIEPGADGQCVMCEAGE